MRRRGRLARGAPLRPPTEFDLIAAFTRGAPREGAGVLLGIGDDCALLEPPRGEVLVATVDAIVEGVHFDAQSAPAEIGWKALAVNVSDVASMGARPLWALCALAMPRDSDLRRVVGVGAGLARCARRFRVALAGGNVTAARDLSLTVTVLGAVPRGRALLRAGARPGDVIAVSGTLGDAALGLERDAPRRCARRQRRPEPRVALGLALRGVASACIDVSDGLLQDLGHVCAASGCGAELHLEKLPLSRAYRAATAGREDPWALAVAGGEDYELCAAIPPRRWARAAAAARAAATPLTAIGEFVAGRGVVALTPSGARYRASRAGHDHLRPRAP
jgi:thiamine-monophosphate kinase